MILQWLLTHQPLLIAVTLLNGAALVALVIGVGYRPQPLERIDV
jgi:hypothetical protein